MVPPSPRFRGEKQDFEEMLGNLLDNAFKWAHHGRGRDRAAGRIGEGEQMALLIDDDGPGLPDDAMRGGAQARPPPRRGHARFRPRPFDRRRPRQALWRRADAGALARSAACGRVCVLPSI